MIVCIMFTPFLGIRASLWAGGSRSAGLTCSQWWRWRYIRIIAILHCIAINHVCCVCKPFDDSSPGIDLMSTLLPVFHSPSPPPASSSGLPFAFPLTSYGLPPSLAPFSLPPFIPFCIPSISYRWQWYWSFLWYSRWKVRIDQDQQVSVTWKACRL